MEEWTSNRTFTAHEAIRALNQTPRTASLPSWPILQSTVQKLIVDGTTEMSVIIKVLVKAAQDAQIDTQDAKVEAIIDAITALAASIPQLSELPSREMITFAVEVVEFCVEVNKQTNCLSAFKLWLQKVCVCGGKHITQQPGA